MYLELRGWDILILEPIIGQESVYTPVNNMMSITSLVFFSSRENVYILNVYIC